jgi:exopolysaccharide biosynthesis polyprenyl glycosylphosphotransferase
VLKRAGDRLTLTLVSLDLALTLLAFQLARLLREALPFGIYLDEPLYNSPLLYVTVAVIWGVAFLALGVYNPARTLHYLADAQTVLVATTIAILLFAGVAYLFFRELSRLLFAYFFLLDLLLLVLGRAGLHLLFRRHPDLWPDRKRRVLIIGTSSAGREIARALQSRGWAQLELVGFVNDLPRGAGQERAGGESLTLPLLGAVADTPRIIHQQRIHEVIIALPLRAHERLIELVVALQELPVNIRLVPDILDLVFIRASVEEFAGLPLIGLREPVIDGVQRWIKRGFDLLVAGAAMVLAAPLMLLTALVIKLETPGPVFFCQQRVGEGGQLFWMIKFRTMEQGAEAQEQELARRSGSARDGPPLFDKRPDDPRVTRVGHLLRRASLDELPQLINVLLGEMSLVGPRPELPWLVERYLPWQRKRFAVPQGMTGWWQVNGRSERSEHQLRVEDDLYYIRNYSLFLDLRILWRTIGSVIRGEGAY